jgi:hypothetical protein
MRLTAGEGRYKLSRCLLDGGSSSSPLSAAEAHVAPCSSV